MLFCINISFLKVLVTMFSFCRQIPTKYITTLVPKCSIILELNKSGQIVRSLQDLNAERFQYPSEVEDQAGVLYIGSFMSPYIGIVDTSKKPPN